MLRYFLVIAAMYAASVYAADLTFISDGVNPGNGEQYKVYIDLSTIHREGNYQTAKTVAIYKHPITAANFNGVKSMVNTFQVDCQLNLKRVTYIGFLDAHGRVIVEEHYPDAAQEQFGIDTVDQKFKAYLCA